MQDIIGAHSLNNIVDPQPVAKVATMKFHTMAQMVNPAVVAVDHTMHLNRFLCVIHLRGCVIQQIFCQMATRKTCGSRQQHPHRFILSNSLQGITGPATKHSRPADHAGQYSVETTAQQTFAPSIWPIYLTDPNVYTAQTRDMRHINTTLSH